jgi:SAM-dependent methyltransferase
MSVHPVQQKAQLAASAQALLLTYAATLFLSAWMLFLVQPMVAKMVLPRLGGSPSVWNTAMCFFQAMLLLGYLYAHLLTRLGRRTQGVIHGLVLLGTACFLPLDLSQATPPPEGIPALWLIGQLAITVGPPFFALSATAPLLQHWFSRTAHRAAADPYFLYAAGNVGSLLALLAYPLLFEPSLPLAAQSRGWAVGLIFVAGGIALCWLGYRDGAAALHPSVPAARPSWDERLRWVALAFVPSALLLAVTAHITTDLVSAPLLWVIPLALYLLSFIFAFASRPPLPHALMLLVQPFLIIVLAALAPLSHSIWLILPVLAMFFVTGMVCHGELARRRPPATSLTDFYLHMSLGGVLGGIFGALLAPALFPAIWEYPLLLAAACLARPASPANGRWARRGDVVLPLLLFLFLVVLYAAGGTANRIAAPPLPIRFAAAMVPTFVLLNFRARRLRFALGVGACLMALQLAGIRDTLLTTRSFFGVYRVWVAEGGALRVLHHGNTVHGVASTRPGEERTPLGYYSREGPFGRFFAAIAHRPIRRVGVIGLGTGGLACYATPGQYWTFHEIDPLIERIAREERFFGFLARCGNSPRVILGDARLTLQDVPNGTYDVIILDAFNSDSIPLHLLTREALALYRRKLAPDGVMLFHISNRYLDLVPVVAALAQDIGAPAKWLAYAPPGFDSFERMSTEVTAIGQPGGRLDDLQASDGWRDLPPAPASALWTDARSAIVSRIIWRLQ